MYSKAVHIGGENARKPKITHLAKVMISKLIDSDKDLVPKRILVRLINDDSLVIKPSLKQVNCFTCSKD